MPGLLGFPTLGKMSINAAGRVWRRLKAKAKAQKEKKEGPEEDKQQGPEDDKKQGPEDDKKQGSEEDKEQGSEEGGHTFYSGSVDTIGYTDSSVDTLDAVETIQEWVNVNSDTHDVFGAWSHPSEVSSIVSFEEPELHRSVSFRDVPDQEDIEYMEPVEPIVPIEVIKPTKRGGLKDVFKNVKAAFKKRDHSG